MLLGLLFIAPLLIGILFSFQSEQELGTYPLHLLSNAPTLQNYLEVIKAVPLFSYLLNSGIVCLVSIATQIVIACLAAYGFVFFEFPLKKLLFSLVLMTTMIPGEVVVITNYTTIQSLHLTNTYAGLVVTSLISGTSIFLMRQFFMTIPKDYKEANFLMDKQRSCKNKCVFCFILYYRCPSPRFRPWRYICSFRSTISFSGRYW